MFSRMKFEVNICRKMNSGANTTPWHIGFFLFDRVLIPVRARDFPDYLPPPPPDYVGNTVGSLSVRDLRSGGAALCGQGAEVRGRTSARGFYHTYSKDCSLSLYRRALPPAQPPHTALLKTNIPSFFSDFSGNSIPAGTIRQNLSASSVVFRSR
jgi:hypothetical protein